MAGFFGTMMKDMFGIGGTCSRCGKALSLLKAPYTAGGRTYCEECRQLLEKENRPRTEEQKPAPEPARAPQPRAEAAPEGRKLTINDAEAWAVRDVNGKYIRQAAELKPECADLGEKDFYRIDYLIARRLSYADCLRIMRTLEEETVSRLQFFVSASVAAPLRQVDGIEEMDIPQEYSSVAAAGQYRLGLAPMMVRPFNQTSIIRVRIFLRANLPLDRDKADAFMEEMMEKAFPGT